MAFLVAFRTPGPALLPIVLTLCAMPVSIARAQADPAAPFDYRACVASVQANPDAAAAMAVPHLDDAPAVARAAHHCLALADVERGAYTDAATRLRMLADLESADPAHRWPLLAQSGEALLLADKPDQALAPFSDALALAPSNAGVLIGRARAFADLGHYEDAITDLSRALTTTPNDADALVLRASALRRLQRFDAALADLNRALTLVPDHPDGLLERGIVYLALGREKDGLSDWRRLVDVAPDTAAAAAARRDLRRLARQP